MTSKYVWWTIPILATLIAVLNYFSGRNEGANNLQTDRTGSPSATYSPLTFPGNGISSPSPSPSSVVSASLEDELIVDPKNSRENEALRLFEKYTGKYIGSGQKGRMFLDEVYALQLPPSKEKFDLIHNLLRSRDVTDQEKAGLARIMSTFYRAEGSELNAGVLSDLREMISLGNVEVGREAMLNYSRLGYFDDSQSLLKRSLVSGYINETDYYGELAHLLPSATGNGQNSIMAELISGKNSYSVEIVSSIVQDRGALANLSPLSIQSLKRFISSNEPGFSGEHADFGLMDAVRYDTWLKSAAAINGASMNSLTYSQFVSNHLLNETNDPRKVLSFLMSDDSTALLANLKATGALDRMQQSINAFAGENPRNAVIAESVAEANARISKVK